MKRNVLEIIMLSIFIIFSFYTQVDAVSGDFEIQNTDLKVASLDDIKPDEWKPPKLTKSSTFETKIGKILGAIRNSGIIASILSLMFIGLRTMFGSIEDKSHYKESIPTFLIGTFVLLACTTIPNIIYEIASTFNDI